MRGAPGERQAEITRSFARGRKRAVRHGWLVRHAHMRTLSEFGEQRRACG